MIENWRDQTALSGRIGIFLIGLIVIHFTYPLSEISVAASAVYVICYTCIIGFGAYIASGSQRRRRITGLMTLLTLVTGVIWAFTSNDAFITSSLYVFYIVIIINLCLIVFTVLEYIFSAKSITRDVLVGAVTLYLLIGNVFTPIYLFLNAVILTLTGEPAFGVHTYEVAITWQRMYYLSFTVLTTLGFGDITPINSFVEPFVLAEAAIGVLYLAILMARLVSLYDGDSPNRSSS